MSVPVIFNRSHLHRQRQRAAAQFATYRFLHDWCEQEILDRLTLIRRDFPVTAFLSSRASPSFRQSLEKLKNVSENKITELSLAEVIDLDTASTDLIISIFDLHTINDLPGVLVQIRRALKPDGLFIACLPGGETLYELRAVLMESELNIYGGASPHVFPFADKQQMGALLQRAGFALPVVDSDILTVAYRDLFHLLQDLRGMGEGNAIAERRKNFMGKRFFPLADEIYREKFPDEGGKIAATFEIISLIGWAPHASQPKPLAPGSAQHSLKDALQ